MLYNLLFPLSDQIGEFRALCHAPQRHATSVIRDELVILPTEHAAGGDRIDPYARRPEACSHMPGQSENSGLAGGVDCRAFHGEAEILRAFINPLIGRGMAIDRRNIHDRTGRVCLFQAFRHLRCEIEDGLDIHLHDVAPDVGAKILVLDEKLAHIRSLARGIVQQAVDPPADGGFSRIEQARIARSVCKVMNLRRKSCAVATIFRNALTQRFKRSVTYVDCEDLRTGLQKAACKLRPENSCCTRDEDPLAVEFQSLSPRVAGAD